jgi:signal transduction histidine kinase
MKSLKEAIEKSDFWSAEYRFRRQDGGYATVLDRAYVQRNREGRPLRIVGSMLDLTARKRIEAQLAFQKTLLEATAEASLDGLLVTAPGRVLYFNHRFAQLWQIDSSRLEGVPEERVFELISAHIENFERFRARLEEVWRDRHGTFSAEINLTNGKIYDCHRAPVLTAEGRDFGWVWAFRDITLRKQAENEAHEARDQLDSYARDLEKEVAARTSNLQESLQSLEGVLYHVAHDLRAPLRAMAGFTQILLQEYAPDLDRTGEDYAERIAGAASRMDKLIHDLLEYGRLAHVPLEIEPVNPEPVIQRVLLRLHDEIQQKQAVIEVRHPFPWLRANEDVLENTFCHLLENALHFAAPDRPPRIVIWAEARPECIRVIVQDNGIGIAPEHQDRIFRVFERLQMGETSAGTGIGLAIVQKGMQRMSGRAGVESEPGKGSRFWFELPPATNQS